MKVYLRALELGDAAAINVWRNDEEIQLLTGGNKYFVSLEGERDWVAQKMNSDKEVYLAICLAESKKMIGYLSLNSIDLRNRRCDWGGIVLDRDERKNSGYGSEAAYLVLKHAFCELGLNKVTGYWLETHKVSIMLGKLLGFREEGKFREHVFKGGKFHNVVVMSLLKPEFEKLSETFEPAGFEPAG